ncbi:hypothetical protein CSC71_00625 [Pseudoxanthomonas sangjuensis]|uniref:transglutaminase family protein n=1 Tax=Pseudoxanthomonas sangjuensis TaxID=1503750 RepID=UPI0013919EEA|nr:transglutaminase family protein [Pseudoxanthomonas sangjuensis]KAF1715781.1 hypothetical protein CSC71_00625 [Pseudoxanthomonas sangjuensis]
MAGTMSRIAASGLGVLLLFGAGGGIASPPVDFKAAQARDANIATLRRLLDQPEGQIDLARAKVAIDHMVDPTVDMDGTLRQVDQWVAKIRSRFPPGATNKAKADVLVSTLYEPGPWNDRRPFGYDYADPYGRDIRKSLLSTYLATRKGQCVVMPTFVALLGQKLGLPMTLTTVPYHLVVKYGDEEQGAWTNLDATSGLFHDDSGYEQALNISPVALKNEIFLRPYSQRESVALFAIAVLAPHYLKKGQPEEALQVLDLILAVNPKDTVAMTLKANAYGLLVDQRFRSKYPKADHIPVAEQAEFETYNSQIVAWRTKAEELGWREWTKADWDKYLKHFNNEKAKDQGGT